MCVWIKSQRQTNSVESDAEGAPLGMYHASGAGSMVLPVLIPEVVGVGGTIATDGTSMCVAVSVSMSIGVSSTGGALSGEGSCGSGSPKADS